MLYWWFDGECGLLSFFFVLMVLLGIDGWVDKMVKEEDKVDE